METNNNLSWLEKIKERLNGLSTGGKVAAAIFATIVMALAVFTIRSYQASDPTEAPDSANNVIVSIVRDNQGNISAVSVVLVLATITAVVLGIFVYQKNSRDTAKAKRLEAEANIMQKLYDAMATAIDERKSHIIQVAAEAEAKYSEAKAISQEALTYRDNAQTAQSNAKLAHDATVASSKTAADTANDAVNAAKANVSYYPFSGSNFIRGIKCATLTTAAITLGVAGYLGYAPVSVLVSTTFHGQLVLTPLAVYKGYDCLLAGVGLSSDVKSAQHAYSQAKTTLAIAKQAQKASSELHDQIVVDAKRAFNAAKNTERTARTAKITSEAQVNVLKPKLEQLKVDIANAKIALTTFVTDGKEEISGSAVQTQQDNILKSLKDLGITVPVVK